jgi:KaiC/GvpD/RAD55 family RecA-like ATPase
VTLHRFIADDLPEPRALLIDGEAGIGKTTLSTVPLPTPANRAWP